MKKPKKPPRQKPQFQKVPIWHMNIFYLDTDTEKNAIYHCDKHVVKMIIETAQLLASAHWLTGGQAPYRLTHKNHPCSVWVRQNIKNYEYLTELGLALCREYTYRYERIHKTEAVLNWLKENPPSLPDEPFTEPPLAMPDQYKSATVVGSYRNYYRLAKHQIATWKKRDVPAWFNEKG